MFVDEVGKTRAAKTALDTAGLCERLLGFTGNATYHRMYAGTSDAGRPGVMVLADTAVPLAFREEVQLGRRVVLCDLGAGVNTGGANWRESAGESVGWRTRAASPALGDGPAGLHADLADDLVSEAADRVADATRNGHPFERFAATLGFGLVRDAADGTDPDADFRELFQLACDAPDWRDGSRWTTGCGWRVFALDGSAGRLADWWREHVGPAAAAAAQPLAGRQWGRVVGIPGLTCDVRPHGRRQQARSNRPPHTVTARRWPLRGR